MTYQLRTGDRYRHRMWDGTATLATEERKVATIIFADLVGSTELSTRMDPEALRGVVMRYFDLLAAQIEQHGGTVEKFIGDAVMAVFGVPATHEDDVRRALTAALQILGALDHFNLELEATYGVRLQVRIGVNTGEVIATRDASTRQGLVAGEIVNLAARLEQHAGPGEILIGAQTFAIAGPAAVTGPVRPLLVKGKNEPIDAYPLLDLRPDDPATTRRFDLPFVGRNRELAALDMAADRVETTGSSSLVMLYGDPGIGKTRLLTEWLGRERTGMVYATARCRADGDDGSLRPLYDLIGQLSAETGSDDASTGRDDLADPRARLIAAVDARLPHTDLYGPLVDFIDAYAGQATVCLVIDDAQWASGLLLEVLDRLCEDLSHQPLLCVCAARPDVSEARPRLGGGMLNFSSVELTAMSDIEVETLATALSDVLAHDAGTVHQLVVRAEGNPLHLEQLAAASQDGHHLGQIPPTIRALIAARLDVLAPSERNVLDIAAIIGREFAATDLSPMLDEAAGAADEVAPVLRAMTRRRLLESTRRAAGQQATHRFASSLIHDVVYESMTKTRRAALHEQAAATDKGGHQARVGGHLAQAYRCRTELGQAGPSVVDLRRRAIGELIAAGTAALHRVDLPWAFDLVRQAVELANPADGEHPAAHELYGEILLATGSRDRAYEALSAACESANKHGDLRVAAHARLLLAQLDPSGGSVEDIARELAETFHAAGDDLGLARTGIRIGAGLQRRGRHHEAVRELRTALDHAVRAGSDIERANTLGALGQSLWLGPTPVPEAIAVCRDLLASHGQQRRAVRATLGFPLTVLLAAGGDFSAAEAELAETRRAMSELGYAEAAVFRPLLGGVVATLAGNAEVASAQLSLALDEASRLGAGSLARYAARELARVKLAAGRPDEAGPLIATVTDPSLTDPVELADVAGLQAWYGCGSGLAREHAERAVAVAATTDSLVALATAHLDRARTLQTSGATAEARAAASLARAAYDRKGHTIGSGAASALIQMMHPRD